MDSNKLSVYKRKLEKERADLMREISGEEKTEDFGGDIDHFDEEADEAEELGNRLAVSHDLKERVNDIDVALNKIRDGKYGICENCGKEIESEILNISPESRLCKNCKRGK